MPRACSQCGCTDIDIDPARGDAVCTNCGTVLEDQIIVSEVQYQESGAGGASVIGQFVSNDGTRAQTFRGPYGHGFSEDARKLTLENGYKRLKEMGGKLRMHQSSIETAFGFFKLAVAQRFTRGRKMEYVLASCLYLVCRVDPGGSEDLELMLIDFSDMVQVNVHVLGRTFVQLATELSQNIRIVDPIIYIRRFANQLHFGAKLNRVVESASRLVARMKRDWMHTGRRPSGLCGAALLISARMHNFNRTVDQIIKVVKVCESTVRKRLLEFDSTPSAQLTIEEFDNVDLEEEQDPPCFTEGKKKAKLAQLNEGKIPESTIKDLNKLQDNINKSLKKKSLPQEGNVAAANLTDPEKAVKVLDEEMVREASGSDWQAGEWEGLGEEGSAKSVIKVCAVAGLMKAEEEEEGTTSKKKAISDEDSGEEDEKNCKQQIVKAKVEDGELDLTGIDDDEIDQMINTEEEYQHKAKWFEAEFSEVMEIVKEREEKRRLKEEAAAKKKEKNPRAKKKKRKHGYDLESELAQCMEMLKRDIKEKKFSDKINYNVLNTLDSEVTDSTVSEEGKKRTDQSEVEEIKESKSQIFNRFRKPSISESKIERKPNIKKRVRIQDPVEESEKKKAKLEVSSSSGSTVVVEEDASLEPIRGEPVAEEVLDEEEDDDYEEDEEEGEDKNILSARQLLGQDVSAYEEEEDYYDY